MVYVWLNWLSWLSFETGTGVVHQIALIKKWKEQKKNSKWFTCHINIIFTLIFFNYIDNITIKFYF